MSTERAQHEGIIKRLRIWAARPFLFEIIQNVAQQVAEDIHKMYAEHYAPVSQPQQARPSAPISPLPTMRPISPMRLRALQRSGAIPMLPAPKPSRLAPTVRQTILDGVKRNVFSDRETTPIPPDLKSYDPDAWLNSSVRKALTPVAVQQEVRTALFGVTVAECTPEEQSDDPDATAESAILKLRHCEHKEPESE